MKQRSPGGGRRAPTGGIDDVSLETTLMASSLLLWLPYSLAAIYVAYCSSFKADTVALSGLPSFAGATGLLSVAVTSGVGGAHNSAISAASSGETGVSMGSVVGNGSAALHRYSAFYYSVFPADFDIAVFVPLFLRVLLFSMLAVSVTVYFAVYRCNGGEYLMAVAWALGTCSGYGWLTSSTGSVQSAFASSGSAQSLLVSATLPSWLWLVVSLLTGFFSGILCKVKDIVGGRHDRYTHLFYTFERYSSTAGGALTTRRQRTSASRSNAQDGGDANSAALRRRQRAIRVSNTHHLVSLGDRLYMVVPFCTGQWFAFILRHGWRGVVVENGTILLSLSLVGYTMLSYKFLKRQLLRASGRVSRSVAERGRSRRHQRRLQQQQQQQRQRQGFASGHSGGDVGANSTSSAEDVPHTTSGEGSGSDSNSAGVSPRVAASLSDEDAEEEITDFFDDVGEVAFIDVIDIISKLFTTSFGVVALGVLGLNIFMTSLCIPFLKALFKLNALVSGVGIVIELIIYEVA